MKTAITSLFMTIGLLFAASAQAASPVMPSALEMTSISASTKVKPAKRAKKSKARKAKAAAAQ